MSKGRILIIEDNMDNHELIRFFLERDGYDTFLAMTGPEGLQAAIKQVPDLVLVDLALPIMDGWDVTRKIRENEKTARLPIVAVTARTMPIDRMRAIEAGCDEYIAKPIDFVALLGAVNRLMERTKRTRG
ncbi:MAG: response regulator [Chloroflexi bacterium]|nr:response regulator [Chloroflexota bacterium]